MKILCFVISFMAFVSTHDAFAQYPNRPIRFAVPAPPGGTADGVARVVSQHMTQAMGQQWLVDNRPGAEPQTSTPEELAAHTKEQYQAWARVIRETGIPQE